MNMSNTIFCLQWDARGELSPEDRFQVLMALGESPSSQQNKRAAQVKKSSPRSIPPQELKVS
jgi:hypothetical protein